MNFKQNGAVTNWNKNNNIINNHVLGQDSR